MRGIAIATHNETQYGITDTDGQQPVLETTMPPIPQGPYNDADYAMPPEAELGVYARNGRASTSTKILFLENHQKQKKRK